jgi:prevent-host-death family protein
MDVGVRELKQRLSEYLERAARGEVIRVTDRGKPKALLTGIRQEQAVSRGLREGWLKPGEAAEPVQVQRVSSRKRALELLREDRDGR